MNGRPETVRLEHVTKKFGDFVAVSDVSLSIQGGTIFGLLGPNGAGKTTTIRMIMNIIIPDSGSIRILGRPNGEEIARRIGYLPEERGLYKKMKVLDHLVFLGEIRGLPVSKARETALSWMDRLEMSTWTKKRIEDLSKGMQQKIQFVGSVIHDPEVVILDEPFSGLDPVNARMLKDLFLEFRDQGKTLIFSTHVMEQAEKLCDDIGIINKSRLVLQGTTGEVRRTYSGNRLVLRGRGDVSRIEAIRGVVSLEKVDGEVRVELCDDIDRAAFLRDATSVWDVESAMPHEASLDEVFVRVVGQSVAAVEKESGTVVVE